MANDEANAQNVRNIKKTRINAQKGNGIKIATQKRSGVQINTQKGSGVGIAPQNGSQARITSQVGNGVCVIAQKISRIHMSEEKVTVLVEKTQPAITSSGFAVFFKCRAKESVLG